jgi:small subunit ribosomal protein S13
MTYVLKTKLANNKPIVNALTSIFGIGNTRSILICKKLGFLLTFKVQNISKNQLDKLTNLIKNISSQVVIGEQLKKAIKKNKKKLISIKSYKGIRLKKGLPAHGQRTHSNARTTKLNKNTF